MSEILPEVLVPDARLLSACGDDVPATLARLADPAPYGDAPEGGMPDDASGRARELAARLGVPEAERTRELLAGLLLAAPLVGEALAAGIPAAEVGLVFGGTTSGTPEITAALRRDGEGREASAPWHLMDIGRTAPVIARATGICGPVFTVSTACTASAKAILEGVRLLRTGRVRAVVAGGVDVLSPLTEGGFGALGARSARRARPFCADRTGLHLGEGGGFLLLTTDAAAFPHAAVRIAGGGETSDAHHICAPDPEGREAAAAVLEALRCRFTGRPVRAGDVDFVILHGTATAQNDAMEARIACSTLPGVPCASLKRAVGHQLAGAGGFGAAVAWGLLADPQARPPLSFQTDTAAAADTALPEAMRNALTGPKDAARRMPCSRILVTAYAFGGSNAALLLERRPAA